MLKAVRGKREMNDDVGRVNIHRSVLREHERICVYIYRYIYKYFNFGTVAHDSCEARR